MSKAVIPVVCTAKTSTYCKDQWKAEGLDLAKIDAQLTYKFLAGMGDTETGAQACNIIQEAASKLAALYDGKLPEAFKANYLEMISVWQATSTNKDGGTGSIFGKGLLAQAVRNNSGLKFHVKPAEVKAASEDDDVTESVEL